MRNSRPSMPFARPAWPRARTACGRPIEEAEREEAIADWLADHGLDAAIAEALAETAVTFEALDRLAGAVDGPALNAVLRWAAAGCSVRGLASEIQDAAMRISGLVIAIKGFTHMDQATVAEPVDLAQGLSNTVAVLRSKARAKSVAVVVKVEPGLPRVRGFAGELNQIWANLIDNALDAVPDGGPRRGAGEPRGAARRGARHRQRGRHSRPRSASASSIRSSRPSRWGTAPAWASTSSGAWSATTTAKSPSSRSRAGRSFGSPCRSPRPTARRGQRMNKPVLLIVDDDPQVLAAVRRDLRSRYREQLHGHERGIGTRRRWRPPAN